mgnify:FL=1
MSEENFESLYKKLIKSKDYELFQRNKTKKSRPNIFKILGVQKKEDLTHSNFLAWIMNPEEKHNIGSSFLELFLLQFMTEQLNKLNLDKINVFREYTGQSGRIDILIETKNFVVCLENKIDSPESPNQLQNYKKIIEKDFPTKKHFYVFLTPDGRESDNLSDLYYPISYFQIKQIIIEILENKSLLIEVNAKSYLESYIEILDYDVLQQDKNFSLSNKIYRENIEFFEQIFNLPQEDQRKFNFYKENYELMNLIENNSEKQKKEYLGLVIKEMLENENFILRQSNPTFIRVTTKKIEKYIYFNKNRHDWPPKFDSFLFEFVIRPNENLIRFRSMIGPTDEEYDRRKLNKIIEKMKDSGTNSSPRFTAHHSQAFEFDFEFIFNKSENTLKKDLGSILEIVKKIINDYELHFEKNKKELFDLKNI